MNVRINKMPMNHFKGDLEKTASEFLRILYVMAALSILSYIPHDFVFSIKALLIFVVSIFVSRESEIFFVTQKFNIMRDEAKETLKTTRPEITGLIYALLLPAGTPLFVVAVGAFISVFIGKMVFGGYTFNVFNPAIVGRLFVAIAWPSLVVTSFPESFDTYLLEQIFSKELTGEVLTPLMQLQADGIVTLEGIGSVPTMLLSVTNGMLFSLPSIVYLILIVFFIVNKTVDLRPFLFSIVTAIILLSVISIGNDLSFTYVMFHILTGGFFFVTLFMMTDPFTKPYSNTGILHYSVIFTVVFALIRFLGKDPDGVLYALLFSNLFVPMLNKKTADLKFAFNPKNIATIATLVVVLVGTGLFINKIIEKRIISKEIVVSAYVQN